MNEQERRHTATTPEGGDKNRKDDSEGHLYLQEMFVAEDREKNVQFSSWEPSRYL